MNFDLAISYTWIYDIEFTQLIQNLFQEKGLSTFIINEDNIDNVTDLVREKKIYFKAYLDRASDVDENFAELGKLLSYYNCAIINPYEKVEPSVDKARIQSRLIEHGLKIPKTLIVPPFDTTPELTVSYEDIEQIGTPFVMKPGYYSGGSDGVEKNAHSFHDIEKARRKNSDDNYLIQEKIYPIKKKGHRSWFRVLWAFGKIIPMLWDDETLLYSDDKPEYIFPELISQIKEQMQKIYEVTELDYFSSEFALNDKDELFLIDYVNDQCDMRLKSNHVDGVPDKIVKQFIGEMIEFVRNVNRPQ